jgi:ribulose-bisphosphate carboxylase large chain
VIFPNAGGRFPFSEQCCDGIHRALRAPLGSIRPAFPVPAGGIAADRVAEWVAHYGPDTIFLVGGSLYAQGDLARAGSALLRSVRIGSDLD